MAKAATLTTTITCFRHLAPFSEGKDTFLREVLRISYVCEFEDEHIGHVRWSFEETHRGDKEGKVNLRSSTWAALEAVGASLRVDDRT